MKVGKVVMLLSTSSRRSQNFVKQTYTDHRELKERGWMGEEGEGLGEGGWVNLDTLISFVP
jgi:hypothetical protein